MTGVQTCALPIYAKAAAYLAKHPDDKDKTKNELQQEQETLLSEIAELKELRASLETINKTSGTLISDIERHLSLIHI